MPSDPNNIDTNDYANEITSTYKTLIDEYMPLKKKSRKQKRFDKRPWLTKGIRVSIDRKDDLYSLSKTGVKIRGVQGWTVHRCPALRPPFWPPLVLKFKNPFWRFSPYS